MTSTNSKDKNALFFGQKPIFLQNSSTCLESTTKNQRFSHHSNTSLYSNFSFASLTNLYNNQLSPEHANAKKHENNSTNSHNATTSTTSSIVFSNLNRRMSRSLCAEDFAGLSMQNNNKFLPAIKNLEEAENYTVEKQFI